MHTILFQTVKPSHDRAHDHLVPAVPCGIVTLLVVAGTLGRHWCRGGGGATVVDDPTGGGATGEGAAAGGVIGCGLAPVQVRVTIDIATLLALAADPGVLDGHGPIDPDLAR